MKSLIGATNKVVGPSGSEEDTGRVVDLSLETLAATVGGRATELANGHQSTAIQRKNSDLSEDLSASSPKDEMELTRTCPLA